MRTREGHRNGRGRRDAENRSNAALNGDANAAPAEALANVSAAALIRMAQPTTQRTYPPP